MDFGLLKNSCLVLVVFFVLFLIQKQNEKCDKHFCLWSSSSPPSQKKKKQSTMHWFHSQCCHLVAKPPSLGPTHHPFYAVCSRVSTLSIKPVKQSRQRLPTVNGCFLSAPCALSHHNVHRCLSLCLLFWLHSCLQWKKKWAASICKGFLFPSSWKVIHAQWVRGK